MCDVNSLPELCRKLLDGESVLAVLKTPFGVKVKSVEAATFVPGETISSSSANCLR